MSAVDSGDCKHYISSNLQLAHFRKRYELAMAHPHYVMWSEMNLTIVLFQVIISDDFGNQNSIPTVYSKRIH